LHSLRSLLLLLVLQRKEIEVVSRLPTMMGNQKFSYSRQKGIFQNIAANNLSLTDVDVMNMEMDKQGRSMKKCIWKKYDSDSSIY
jgi:hypothetical protein